jgi:hypothetical protein
MSMFNRFRQMREAASQRDHRANWAVANVGAVVNGENIVASPRGDAWVYCTIVKGDNNGAVTEALVRKVTPYWNLPVLLSVNKKGLYMIEETDPDRIDMFTSGTDAGMLGGFDTAPHTHNSGALGQDFVPNVRLADGRVVWRNEGAYVVYVSPFFYSDSSGADAYWPGGTIDLVTYLTVVSGEYQWIKVGLDVTSGALTAIAGTTTPIPVLLDEYDLASINFAPNDPLAGVLITYGQAIQAQSDILDCSLVKSGNTGGTFPVDKILVGRLGNVLVGRNGHVLVAR